MLFCASFRATEVILQRLIDSVATDYDDALGREGDRLMDQI